MTAVYTASEWRGLLKHRGSVEFPDWRIPVSAEVVADFLDGEFLRSDGRVLRMTHIEVNPEAREITPIWSVVGKVG